jgi:hypothetical protein
MTERLRGIRGTRDNRNALWNVATEFVFDERIFKQMLEDAKS